MVFDLGTSDITKDLLAEWRYEMSPETYRELKRWRRPVSPEEAYLAKMLAKDVRRGPV